MVKGRSSSSEKIIQGSLNVSIIAVFTIEHGYPQICYFVLNLHFGSYYGFSRALSIDQTYRLNPII
jgi:hypothetical protein